MAAALPATLRSVTQTKIVELKKQRDLYENSRAQVEKSAKQHDKQLDRVEALLKGSLRVEGVRVPDDSSDEEDSPRSHIQKLNNYRKLLKQARVDRSFPPAVLDRIQQDLQKDLQRKSLQHQHAQFYSELVTEWISEANEAVQADTTSANHDALSTSDFENVGRKEMHEQRKEWESLVFSDPAIDARTLSVYLETLFNSRIETKRVYEKMKKEVATFCHDLKAKWLFTSDSLKVAIKTLLGSDLLSDDKKAILKTFSTNKEVLKEVSDVLHMRFVALETWQWTTTNGAIALEQRRHLNGKYRVYMDEDVLDALFMHQIGMEWAAFLKPQFTTVFHSFAWKRVGDTVPAAARERRKYFLGKDETSDRTVPKVRGDDYAVHYFMTQLPDNVTDGPRGYGDSDDEHESPRKNPLEVKHGLLHLLLAEALIDRHLHPERAYSILRSDYRWFGPSLPHATIFSILKFFGVDDLWCNFIRKFLQAPLRFIQDGPNGQVRERVRGVPVSHIFSDVLTELILFVGDFAVNQATKQNLYRMHDDFWFWGPLDICRKAWQEMATFASVMGLEFNKEKTGSVTIRPVTDDDDDELDSASSDDSKDSSGLPRGDIRWGFLKLNPKTVRFEIDREKVDEHIKELKLQLDSCNSIFSYVQAYNSYASRFFTNNLGAPSFAFGRQHVDAMIETFEYIQKSLFPTGRITDYLSTMASSRFGVSSSSSSSSTTTIPEGFWYMPITLGGLELRNPVIPLVAMRESMRQTPARILERALEKDESDYLEHKDKWLKNNSRGGGAGQRRARRQRQGSAKKKKTQVAIVGTTDDGGPEGKEEEEQEEEDGDEEGFLPRDEYLRYREERSHALGQAYVRLMAVPDQQSPDLSPEVDALFNTVDQVFRKRSRYLRRGELQSLDSSDSYWRWIVALYGPEIFERFGSLQMVDPGQVPLGVVGVMKAGKIRWRG